MNDAVPADPLVPVEVDLRGLAFMPLDVVRLLDSDLFALTNGEEFKAALSLWCKAWLQVPAASLPNDDRVLAYLSGAGGRWGRVKGIALRGWQLCSDDRLYHPVIAEKALAAWEERVAYRERRDNEAERLRRHREEHKRLRDQLREFGIIYPHSAPMETLRSALQDAELNRQRSVSGNAPERVSTPLPDTGQLRLREGEGQREGQREGEGEGEGYLLELPLPPEGGAATAAGNQGSKYSADFESFWREYPKRDRSAPKPDAWKAWGARLKEGISPQDLIRAAANYRADQAAKGKVGTEYVKLPSTFLGKGEHWRPYLGPQPEAQPGSQQSAVLSVPTHSQEMYPDDRF
ncbi:DUF1376 domain-containing protein [Pseudomonas nicosulfuronedens]